MGVIKYPNDVVVVNDFLTAEECSRLILRGENQGFEEATITLRHGQEMHKEVRNNDRVMFDDFEMERNLFSRLHSYVPDSMDGWYLNGLNERFRFYRYTKGQYFKWHRDGSFVRDYNCVSKITFMIYLNEDFEGGNTEFEGFNVVPKTGAALIFPHKLKHQGGSIRVGNKYVLRTDVMYFRG